MIPDFSFTGLPAIRFLYRNCLLEGNVSQLVSKYESLVRTSHCCYFYFFSSTSPAHKTHRLFPSLGARKIMGVEKGSACVLPLVFYFSLRHFLSILRGFITLPKMTSLLSPHSVPGTVMKNAIVIVVDIAPVFMELAVYWKKILKG